MSKFIEETLSITGFSSQEPVSIVSSSSSLPWKGFLVEKRLTAENSLIKNESGRFTIWQTMKHSLRIEGDLDGTNFSSMVKPPGSITFTPVGPLPAVWQKDAAELMSCSLEDQFIRKIADEMDERPLTKPRFRSGLRNRAIAQLLKLLFDEMESSGCAGVF